MGRAASVLAAVIACVSTVHAQTLRYGTYVSTSVTFTTTDDLLQGVYTAAENSEAGLVMMDGAYRVLVEGGGYNAVWIETQPMGGEMYAKRNLEVALNNQLIFIDNQRADGLLPAMVNGGSPDYSRLQGYCFPQPAWKMYSLIGKPRAYLDTLYQALVRHDNWLWANRDTDHDGVLETSCACDMGEDGTTRYNGVTTPIECMDIMAYSYDGRNTLAKIAAALGNGQQAFWQSRADSVRQKLAGTLWDSTLHACYDRNASHTRLTTLVHNSLRCMYHGVFSQQMADGFLRYHLFNRSEFWTPFPLVSIAKNDPKFFYDLADRNNWSGAPEGLTFQRTLAALHDYGHYAEVGLIGEHLFRSLSWFCHFTQQFDPITSLPYWDGYHNYGPSQLSALEYIAHLYGVRRDEDTLHWSGLARASHTQEYTQVWGANQYRIRTGGGTVRGYINSTEVFNCTPGVRVVTDLAGNVMRAIGIDTVSSRSVTLNAGASAYTFTVHPNEVLNRNGATFVSARQTAYDYDPRVPVGKPWGPVLAERWSSKAIRVHWMERFSNQTGFAVQRADDSAFTLNPVSFVAQGSDTCFIDNTVTAGRAYYYRAKAQGPSGESGYSYVTKATAQDPWLSDIEWFVLRCPTAGYAFQRDKAAGGGSITLNGTTFTKGIATHAPSKLVYDLGGLYSRFIAQVGVDDDAGTNGTVTFNVFLDSDTSPAFASGLMRGGNQRKSVDLDLSGRQKMILVVTDGGDGIGNDHADWADAKLTGAVITTGVTGRPAAVAGATPHVHAAGPNRLVSVTGLGRTAWTIRVVDAAGRVAASRKAAGVDEAVLDVSGLAAGAYVVRMEGARPVAVRTVVAGR